MWTFVALSILIHAHTSALEKQQHLMTWYSSSSSRSRSSSKHSNHNRSRNISRSGNSAICNKNSNNGNDNSCCNNGEYKIDDDNIAEGSNCNKAKYGLKWVEIGIIVIMI